MTMPMQDSYGYAFMRENTDQGNLKKVWLQLYPRVMWEGEWVKVREHSSNAEKPGKTWFSDSHVSGEIWHTEKDMKGRNVGEVSVLDVARWTE